MMIIPYILLGIFFLACIALPVAAVIYYGRRCADDDREVEKWVKEGCPLFTKADGSVIYVEDALRHSKMPQNEHIHQYTGPSNDMGYNVIGPHRSNPDSDMGYPV